VKAFFNRHALLIWLAGLCLAGFLTARATYVADLSAFLPANPSAEQAVLLDQLRSGVAARLVLMGVEGGTPAARASASTELAQALRQSGAFDAVHNGDNTGFEATGQFLFEHRYLLSPAINAQRFTPPGLRGAMEDTTALLGTAAGAMLKPILWRDPTGETMALAEAMLPAQAPRSEGGVWVSRNAQRAVLLATTRADGADLDAQERTLQQIRTFFAPHAAHGLKLVVSGAGTFAVESRARIKTEVERLGAAGGIAIVVLMLLALGGSLRSLGLALLPVASGVLAGIAAVSVCFGNVHGITLGFGTTLIGEAVDYAIYYLIQVGAAGVGRTTSPAQTWITTNWPTVRLGLWTSLCGFAALLFSGFPGLAQLGVFSIAGLAAAAFTTRWVFPKLATPVARGARIREKLGRAMATLCAVLPRLRWPLTAVAVLAAVALLWWPSAWRGDLASLSPVSPAQIKLDTELRTDVGASDAGTLIAVSAPDEAQVLARTERVAAQLDPLVAQGALQGYESPTRILPSPALQTQRQRSLPDAATLTARLREASGPLPTKRLDQFVTDVQTARQQPLLTRASLQNTPLASAVDAQLVPGQGTRPWRTLLSLQVNPDKPLDLPALRAALTRGLDPADAPHTQIVNIKTELDALYTRYLHEARLQALLGAAAVLLLLAWHLRSAARLWRIAQPITAAVVIVLAALTASGVALGILHLVGLLLTVAIGSNYALFFDQMRHPIRQESQAPQLENLASLALANLTAVISFGLLALSNIPALQAIGVVVAPGILLSLWLSAALMGS
jgi:predicted exporter